MENQLLFELVWNYHVTHGFKQPCKEFFDAVNELPEPSKELVLDLTRKVSYINYHYINRKDYLDIMKSELIKTANKYQLSIPE